MRNLSFLLASCAVLFSSAPAVAQSPAPAANGASVQASTARCNKLAELELPNVTIATAKAVAAGAFSGLPQNFTGRDLSAFYKTLPPFCRVVAHAHPSSDSDIVIEVWMPLAGWNGKLQGLGQGGFAGQIDSFELGASAAKGYAAGPPMPATPVRRSTQHGHSAIRKRSPTSVHRGIHEMTRVAKEVISQFYGSAVKHAYFAACSDGGREALMEAQRYPDDYDGILAGAPANYWTGLLSLAAFDTQVLSATPASFIPPPKIITIAHAVVAACDKLDGAEDGIIDDPRLCHFDPASIECKAGEDDDKCLTASQVATLKTIYAGLHDSGGKPVFPGYLPGAEEGANGWTLWITGPAPARSLMAAFGIGYFSDMVYDNTDWSFKSFTLASGMQTAKEKTSAALDATNPDLSAFHAHGGKLILYHGWDDPAIPALNTVNFYGNVVAKMGRANVDSFVRLYMLPGVQHCGGGPGPDAFGQSASSAADDPEHNVRIALENWVEKGTAPETLIASKTAEGNPPGGSTITRPLCPYPQTTKYKGRGDVNKAENFVCESPEK